MTTAIKEQHTKTAAADPKSWLESHGFTNTYGDEFYQTYQKHSTYSRGPYGGEYGYYLKVYMPTNHEHKCWAELSAGGNEYSSEKFATPKEATDQVLNDFLHMVQAASKLTETFLQENAE